MIQAIADRVAADVDVRLIESQDAGVIIENAPIAQYFEKIFLFDWNTKAKPFVANKPA